MILDSLSSYALQYSPAKDNPDFQKLTRFLEAELAPVGAFEVLHASHILHSQWRIRCYNLTDEMQIPADQRHAFQQLRIREINSARRMTSDLRRLQSERQVREQLAINLTGLASSRELVQIAATVSRIRSKTEPGNGPALHQMEGAIHAKIQREQEILKKRTQSSSALSPQNSSERQNSGRRTHSVPSPGRNAPCPCRSGQKYKRCCGRNTTAAPHPDTPAMPKAA